MPGLTLPEHRTGGLHPVLLVFLRPAGSDLTLGNILPNLLQNVFSSLPANVGNTVLTVLLLSRHPIGQRGAEAHRQEQVKATHLVVPLSPGL